MRRTLLGLSFLALALLLLQAFWGGAEAGSDYAVHYGMFPLSPGESSLRLNMILWVLPAAAAAAWGAALLGGDRIRQAFAGLRGSRAWDAALALWLLAASWAVRRWILHGAEVTDDENAYAFQARLLQSGRLFVDSLPGSFRAFLDNQFIVNDGRRYAAYFLGHPAWLAVFERLGLPDLAGPVAVALTGPLSVATARRVFGGRAAAITAGLMATSPFLVALGATHLSQPTTGLALALFSYALVRLHDEPGRARWWALGAGAVSAAVLTRPQSAAGFLLVGCGGVAFATWRRQLVPARRALAAGLGVGALGIALLFWVNAARSGHFLRSGYTAYMAQGVPWMFPVGFGHSVRQAADALGHLQFWLFGWPISLLFVPWFQRSRLSWLLAGMVGATALLFAASAIPMVAAVGPVYYGESIPILAMLSASGLERAVTWVEARAPGRTVGAALAALPLCLSALGLVTFLPPQLGGLARSAAVVRLPYRLAEDLGDSRAVVFVGRLPSRAIQPYSWAFYHRNADPDLRDRLIFVRDLGPDRDRAFLAYLGDRAGYVLTRRGGGFAIEPLEPAAPR